MKNFLFIYFFYFSFIHFNFVDGKILLGIDQLFEHPYSSHLKGKNIGLVTNHTGINSKGQSTIEIFKNHASSHGFKLQAIFAPEHGLTGLQYASELVQHQHDKTGLPIFSLHGVQRRPTQEMLKNISLLVFDIQDLGSRSYTYISTLFLVMEEAAKAKIPFMVLDRPNPLGGLLVDGPMLEEKFRSFVGYINVPYCHGLTIGELAHFFNTEYAINCELIIVPMKGWRREMSFDDTDLMWIPTSPQIPDAITAFYYPTTGLLGELGLVNMGVGYTLPFKLIGAPWIDANQLAQNLNQHNLTGVYFYPFHYRPFFGRFAGLDCHGVLISIQNPQHFLPVTTQFVIFGTLKNLYPTEFKTALDESSNRIEMFNKVNGTAEVYRILKDEKFIIWKLRTLHQKEKSDYMIKRKSYLNPNYQ